MAVGLPRLSSAADNVATSSPGARPSVAQASRSSLSNIDAIVDEDRYARRMRICRQYRDLPPHRQCKYGGPALRILDPVGYMNDVLGFHDEAVAHAIEGFEHHKRAGPFVRQLHVLRAQTGHSAQIASIHRVMLRAADLENSQHIARCKPVAGAAVDDHHLILADDGDAVGYGHDAAVNLHFRRTRDEIQRHIDAAREQLVAELSFASGFGHDESGRVAESSHTRRGGTDA